MSEGQPPPLDQFAQIFGDFFGGGPLVGRGEDLVVPLELPADLARTGTRRTLTVERKVPCAACAGQGGEVKECAPCGGKGRVTHTQGFFQIAGTCAACRGRGKVVTRACGACDDGRVPRGETLAVEVPAGVRTGTRLRLPDKGHQLAGHPPGHLYIAITVLGEAPAAVDEGAIAAAGAHPFREHAAPQAVAAPSVRAVARSGARTLPLALLVAIAAGLLAYLVLR